MTRKRAAATLSADSSRMTGRIEKPESRGALMWHNAEAVSKSLLTKIGSRAVSFDPAHTSQASSFFLLIKIRIIYLSHVKEQKSNVPVTLLFLNRRKRILIKIHIFCILTRYHVLLQRARYFAPCQLFAT